METINNIAEFINSSKLLGNFALPIFLCCMVILLNSGHKEYSKNAIRNTSASVCVYVFNLAVLILLLPNVKETATGFYNAINLPTLSPEFWDSTPFLLTVLIAFMAVDFADYCIHRLMHTKWFWPTHAAHHSDTHVNAFTTFRIHIFEAILMSLTYVVLLTWMQLPDRIPIVIFFGRLFNMYVHMDLPYKHGPFRYFLASPVFHRWHHADTPKAHGKNLANMFPFYDVLFGTYYEAEVTKIPMGAKSSKIEDINPLKIYIYPFEEWARLIKSEWKRFRIR